jgi:hypothetical protein
MICSLQFQIRALVRTWIWISIDFLAWIRIRVGNADSYPSETGTVPGMRTTKPEVRIETIADPKQRLSCIVGWWFRPEARNCFSTNILPKEFEGAITLDNAGYRCGCGSRWETAINIWQVLRKSNFQQTWLPAIKTSGRVSRMKGSCSK